MLNVEYYSSVQGGSLHEEKDRTNWKTTQNSGVKWKVPSSNQCMFQNQEQVMTLCPSLALFRSGEE